MSNTTIGNGSGTYDISPGTDSTVTVGNGNDTIVVAGGSTDKIAIGNGNDGVTVTGATDDTIGIGSGVDKVTLTGGSDNALTIGNGNDTINASTEQNDTITAGAGNDTITAGASSKVTAGNGNDTITAGAGSSITAGNGNDTVNVGANDTVALGNGTDKVAVTAGTGSQITLGSGADAVTASGGSGNVIAVGNGNDVVNASGDTDDIILAGNGNDTITAGAGSTITTTDGTETVSLFGVQLSVATVGGGDTITAGANSTIAAGNGNDTITAGGDSTITAGNGTDTIVAGVGSIITAGSATDALSVFGLTASFTVADGNDTITAGANSTIIAGDGNDSITAGANSTITVGAASDVLSLFGITIDLPGGNGTDTVTAGADSTVTVGNGNASIAAGADNTVLAGNGKDTVSMGWSDNVTVGTGDDTMIIGTSGEPTLTAPAQLSVTEQGSITLPISAALSALSFGADTIAGFAPATDKIEFSTSQFANFAAVMAAAKQVGSNTVITTDAADSITLTGVTLSSLKSSDFVFVSGGSPSGTVAVTISGIPSGVALSDSAGGLTITNGSVTLTTAQLAGLTLQANAVVTANLTVTATNIVTGQSVSQPVALTVIPFTPDQIAALTPAQIAALTPAEIAALTPSQIEALSATQIGAFSPAQVDVLTPIQLGALSATQVAALTTADVTSLSAPQVAAVLGALTPGQIAALTTAQVAALTPSQIAALTAAQVDALTAAQIAALSTTQVAALTVLQIGSLSPAQVDVLTPTQLGALSATQVAALTTVDVTSLSTAQVTAVLGSLTSSQIAALSTAQVDALTAPQIAALTVTQVEALTPSQIATLSTAQIDALTAPQIAALSTAQVAALTATQIASLSPAQVDVLTPTQLGILSATQVAALTAADVASLSSGQVTAVLGLLAPSQIAALTTTQVQTLTPTQIAGLTTLQTDALTTIQIAALSTTQVDALTVTQIGSLSASQVDALTPTQLGTLSPIQIAALTTADVASLSTDQVTAVLGSLTPSQIPALTTPQIQALTPTQIAGLTTPQTDALTTSQIAALSTTQVDALTVIQLGSLSAPQVDALTTADVMSLSPAQVTAVLASLTPAQLGVLSAAQVGAGLPAIAVPGAQTLGADEPTTISDINLSESGSTSFETFTVTLTDADGLLSATGSGVSNSGTTDLTITGSLSQVNADLATLSDTDATVTVGTPEYITVNASDSFGDAASPQTIAVSVELPLLNGADAATATEYSTVTLGANDSAVEDSLGPVTITGLPTDLSNFSGGTYTASSGTWTGTAAEFNALSFSAGDQGSYTLSITATATGPVAGSTTENYALNIYDAPVLATPGLVGEIIQPFNYPNSSVNDSAGQTPDATFTATDVNYGPTLASVSQFLDANGQTDGNTVSNPTVADAPFDNIYLQMDGDILLTGGVTYTFLLASDDGSALSINGTQVIDDDGQHGVQTVTGTFTPETTGLYPIEIQYFQGGGGAALDAQYSTDGVNFTDLTSVLLSTPLPANDGGSVAQGGTVTLGMVDFALDADDVLGNVTITGLPDDLSNFNDGTYTAATGTWVGTAAEFNALSFTAGGPGNYALTIAAATTGPEAATTTQSYLLSVSRYAFDGQPITVTPAQLVTDVTPADANQPFTLTGVSNAIDGTVTLDNNGDAVFTPDAGYLGQASFTFTATDGSGAAVSGTDNLDVIAPATLYGPAPGLAGEIIQPFNYPNSSVNDSVGQTPDATFTATDIDYGPTTASVSQFLDADGQTDGNTVSNPTIANAGFDNIYMQMDGDIALTGGVTYTFLLASDDGSALSINGTQVIDDDGQHGVQTATGTFTPETTGLYSIEIQYFQGGGGAALDAQYSTDGVNFTDLTSAVLSHSVAGNSGSTVNQDSTVSLGVSDVAPNSVDTLGDVTITGLPDDLSNFNGGAYNGSTGTWVGTAAELNALSFTTGAPGTYALSITAATTAPVPATTTENYTLTVSRYALEGASITLSPAQLATDVSPADANQLLTLTGVADAVDGTVTLGQNGDAVFTPDAGYTGAASFTFTATDGAGVSVSGTDDLNIMPAATIGVNTSETTGFTPVSGNNTIPVSYAYGDAALAPAGDGFVAVGGQYLFEAQMMDEAGNPIGGAFQLGNDYPVTYGGYATASLPDGGFVVGWTDYNSNSLNAEIFNADGSEASGQISVPFDYYNSDSPVNPSIAALSDGDFVMSWTNQNYYDVDDYVVFDSSGNDISGIQSLPFNVYNSNAYSSVTALDTGGFALAAQDDSAANIYVQTFDATGNAASQAIMLGGSEPNSATLSNGDFVVGYVNSSGVVSAALFNAQGQEVGAVTVPNSGADSVQAVALSHGDFALEWSQGGTVYAEAFGATGGPLSAAVALDSEYGADIVGEFNYGYYAWSGTPAATSLANGDVVFSWFNYNDGNEHDQVFFPGFSGQEGQPVALPITVSLDNVDGSESISSIVIAGVPAGATLSAGTEQQDGSWLLTPSELAGLTFIGPSPFYTGTFTLTVTATTADSSTGQTAATVFTQGVLVTPVSYAPTLTVQDVTGPASLPGSPNAIALDISAGVIDPNEQLTSLVISGLPTGVVVSDGAGNSFTASGPSSSVNVEGWNLSGLTLATTSTEAGQLGLTVTATAQNGDATPSTTTATFDVTVGPMAPGPVLTVSGTADTYVEHATPITVAPTLTLTDSAAITLSGAQVAITGGFDAAQDLLAFTSPNGSGISGSYNATTGILTLSGTASVAAYQSALQSVTFQDSGDTPAGTPRSIAFSVTPSGMNGLVYDSANGDYFEYVPGNYTWSQAEGAAGFTAVDGMQGYLATISSAAENTFITNNVLGGNSAWIAGTRVDQSTGVAGTDWFWADGPQQGTVFYNTETSSSQGPNGQYTNWNGGEPNDSGGAEQSLEIYSNGTWNDLTGASGMGYVVEFGGMPGDQPGQLTATATIDVDPPSPVLGGATSKTVTEGGSVTLGATDTAVFTDDALGNVTITGLPANSSNFSGGSFSGTSWTGTAAQFNALSFTAGNAGSYDLSISATTNGAALPTAESYSLTVDQATPKLGGATSDTVTEGGAVTLDAADTAAFSDDALGNVTITGLPTNLTSFNGGTYTSATGIWVGTAVQFNALQFTTATAGISTLSITATTAGADAGAAATESYTLTVDQAAPVFGGPASDTVTESGAVTLGATDTAAFNDDTLGNVTIAGLPTNLTSFNGGTYAAATGTWVGTAAQFNALQFTTATAGTSTLSIAATTAGTDAGAAATETYNLTVDPAAPLLSGPLANSISDSLKSTTLNTALWKAYLPPMSAENPYDAAVIPTTGGLESVDRGTLETAEGFTPTAATPLDIAFSFTLSDSSDTLLVTDQTSGATDPTYGGAVNGLSFEMNWGIGHIGIVNLSSNQSSTATANFQPGTLYDASITDNGSSQTLTVTNASTGQAVASVSSSFTIANASGELVTFAGRENNDSGDGGNPTTTVSNVSISSAYQVAEGSTVQLDIADAKAFSDDTLGTVTVTGLPTNSTNFNGGSYTASSGTWIGTAAQFNALTFTAGNAGSYTLSISATTNGATSPTVESYSLTVDQATPKLGGATSDSVTEGGAVTLSAADTAAFGDDTLGSVTITGLPANSSNVSAGSLSGTSWTGTAAQFNALTFTAGNAGTYTLAISATTTGTSAGMPATETYTLTVDQAAPVLNGATSDTVNEGGSVTLGATDTAAFVDDTLGNVTITGLPANSSNFSGGSFSGTGWTGTAAQFNALSFTAGNAGSYALSISATTDGAVSPTAENYTLTVDQMAPVLGGATSDTVNEGVSVTLGAADTAAFSDDTLGNVTITGLSSLAANFNGGTYTAASGTWTGTAAQFTALSFTDNAGTYALGISATTTGTDPGSPATEGYTLTVNQAAPTLGGATSNAVIETGPVTLDATDTAAFSDDTLGNVTITGLPTNLTGFNGGTYTAATGTWIGTAAQFNALKFTTATAGTSTLSISATTTGTDAGAPATENYTLTVDQAAPILATTSLTTVASFNSESPNGLIADANGDLFGTTFSGGQGYGTVFELKNNGTVSAPSYASSPTVLVKLNPSTGVEPQSALVADANGDLFGTAPSEGSDGDGTVFEVKNNGTVAAPSYASTATALVNFNPTIGIYPSGSLIVDANGDLFGTTSASGTNNDGTVFEIKNNGTVSSPNYASGPTVLVALSGADDAPTGALVEDANGDLFGIATDGGPRNDGMVFEITNNGTVAAPSYASTTTQLAYFTGSNGMYPEGNLIIDANGDLFGTTEGGGAHSEGTVFEIKNTGTVAAPNYSSNPATLVSFSGSNGSNPISGLLVDPNGDLFGTTEYGGPNNDGTVFEIENNGTVAAPNYASSPTTVVNFNGSNGELLQSGLIANVDGDLFGTTAAAAGTAFEIVNCGYAVPVAEGGTATLGVTDTTAFSDDALGNVTITGLPTNLTGFNGGAYTATTGTWVGTAAQFNALQFSAGNLGTSTLAISATTSGSDAGAPATENYTLEVDQQAAPVLGGATSASVSAGGTVTLGATDTAAFSDDTLGNVTITGLPTNLTGFNGGNYTAAAGTWTGTAAQFNALQFTTATAGTSTLSISAPTAGTDPGSPATETYTLAAEGLTTLVDFTGSNGDEPLAGLITDANGNLLGTTAEGGSKNDGTVFEIKNTGTVAAPNYASSPITLINFTSSNSVPLDSLIADAHGDLFGTTEEGGANNQGTVFEIKNTGTVAAPSYASAPTTLISLNYNSDGDLPNAGLVADANGDLFGTTLNVAGGDGAVFEVKNIGTVAAPTYASSPSTLVTFNGSDGELPYAGLIADANGDLFGTTEEGGSNGDGVVFELKNNGTVSAPSYASNPVTLISFNGSNGGDPEAGLIADAKGDLFGTAQVGGANNDGTVFEIANNGTVAAPSYASSLTTLVSFSGSNGEYPLAGLIVDANGDLFGTTPVGGTDSAGTVFEIKNNGTVAAPSYASTPTTLNSFTVGNGAYPGAGLIADAQGDLIGTTQAGGSNDGVVFEIKGNGYVVPDPLTIANGGSFEIASASEDAVTFGGTTGSLLLDQSQGFVGTVAGFTGQDQIDLKDISFGANTTLGYAANTSNTLGVLTVSDGTHTANIALLGQYTAASFATASDGNGGTMIVDPPVVAQNPITQPHA